MATSVDTPPPQPDRAPWNSLERAKLAASVLMPVAICVATLSFNWSANRREESAAAINRELAENARLVDRELADKARLEARDVEITKTFAGLIQQQGTCTRFEAVMVLIDHSTPQHAARLKEQLEKYCALSVPEATLVALRTRGDRALESSKAKEIDSVIAELNGSERGAARQTLIELFQSDEQLAGTRLAAALDASPTYRVALGVLVVLGSSAQRWDRAGVLGPPFERLARSTLMKDATFKEWYERARANQR